jgi:hypothetical protein
MRLAWGAVALVLAGGAAEAAVDVGIPRLRLEGYADMRILRGSQEESWYDGGLGKTRYGDEDSGARLTELLGSARLQITEDLSAVAVIRIEDYQKTFVDVMEAYVRYRPVSTGAWRWSVKAGAFFAPISLENTEIGWTSEWTLTPSAINSWVGNELRTIGAEAEIEWRSEARTLSVVAAAYGYNDPAGVLIAFHGWTLDDRVMTLIDRARIPDVLVTSFGGTPPGYSQEILETDGRVGWYAGANWEEHGFGAAHLLYYDNRADPASFHHGDFGWLTRFWSVGLSTGYDDFVLLAQGMWGETIVEPFGSYSETDFASAYVLAGWYISEEWRLAARADWFTARENSGGNDEDGYALTAALTWLPKEWLRFTAEVLNVHSKRDMRTLAGDDAEADEVLLQLSGRVYL